MSLDDTNCMHVCGHEDHESDKHGMQVVKSLNLWPQQQSAFSWLKPCRTSGAGSGLERHTRAAMAGRTQQLARSSRVIDEGEALSPVLPRELMLLQDMPACKVDLPDGGGVELAACMTGAVSLSSPQL